ncbi:MAG: hypothetical protein ACTSR8_17865 [Promethearchaeota archaeon]
MEDPIDIEDLEAFIKGLKNSFDALGNSDPIKSHGFQSQLARAISMLRVKKQEKVIPQPDFIGQFSKEGLKTFLLKKLDDLKDLLEENQKYPSRKFKLVMQITQLRAKIRDL